ncbi:YlxR family protein [Aerococcaceae bacterium DSM 111020]|nr:YlxR family protein [Aerococcaceae bacterium DSM 111020]
MAKQPKKRKIPMRKCIVSGEMFPKKELVRIVKNKDNEVSIDPTGRKNGRGAYIALVPELAEQARENKTFNKVFSMSIDDSFYDELVEYVVHIKARQELFDED